MASGVRQYDLTRNIVDEILPAQESSTGPLALAEIDGRGSWDLELRGETWTATGGRTSWLGAAKAADSVCTEMMAGAVSNN